ncbi:MAG TPA: hypothetical protein VMJ70_13705 [Candidatus Sulfotelmatobacter sp.]|nr:hypothetical protein [Candidatus Sulfotelmatobacter sp.]
MDFNFLGGPFHCGDVWAGAASGGVSYGYRTSYPNPNRARFTTVCAVSPPIAVDALSEKYLFRLTISNAGSTGPDLCAGCTDGACLVFEILQLTQPPGIGDVYIANPLLRQYAVWQGVAANTCPQATPTRNSTWGAVKSFYR